MNKPYMNWREFDRLMRRIYDLSNWISANEKIAGVEAIAQKMGERQQAIRKVNDMLGSEHVCCGSKIIVEQGIEIDNDLLRRFSNN